MRREKLEGRINIDDYVKRLGEDFGTTDRSSSETIPPKISYKSYRIQKRCLW